MKINTSKDKILNRLYFVVIPVLLLIASVTLAYAYDDSRKTSKIAQDTKAIVEDIKVLIANNKELNEDNNKISRKNQTLVRCVAKILADYTQTQQPIILSNLDKCITSSSAKYENRNPQQTPQSERSNEPTTKTSTRQSNSSPKPQSTPPKDCPIDILGVLPTMLGVADGYTSY